MGRFIINGGRRLTGEAAVHGAKNSVLPVLAATYLCSSEAVIHNCPRISDVEASGNILSHLGCKVDWSGGVVKIDPSSGGGYSISENLMREMRSSIVFLGPVLAKTGRAFLSSPGGCEIGPRPIDLHLAGLKAMGMEICEEGGFLDCRIPNGFKGAKVSLAFPSVGATENIMIAATMAKGETVINNAAREPEISDLAAFLNSCGAKIYGAGQGTIRIEGVPSLHGAEHSIIPDRIETATLLAAAAMTRGEVTVHKANADHLTAVLSAFEEAGSEIEVKGSDITLKQKHRPLSVRYLRTMPYPGFPTDTQALMMALQCISEGASVIVENIFDNRFKHVGELCRLGANIKLEGRVAVIVGVDRLIGAELESTDLRGGAALVIAGLAAQGKTIVNKITHVDRGYEELENTLSALGADIRREETSDCC